jgi:hypothetical protein
MIRIQQHRNITSQTAALCRIEWLSVTTLPFTLKTRMKAIRCFIHRFSIMMLWYVLGSNTDMREQLSQHTSTLAEFTFLYKD